ncbi:hypothetical protein [Streptomyces sp. NPDC015125]|uniref:hypothetical protein n=1 Tax=Streptomyces sp. NPDC015125 TaxID=3364938 RepID=UPI003700F7E4
MGVTAIARSICGRLDIDCSPRAGESSQAALRRAIRVHEIRSLLTRGMLGRDVEARYADEWRPSCTKRRDQKLWTSAGNARRWDG